MEDKKEDILDSIKKIEKTVKLHVLLKSLEELKQKAKRVMELKEEAAALLEEADVNPKDIKRVIDFVNESIKLTDDDKVEIRKKMKEFVKDKKNDTQKEINKSPFYFGGATGSNSSITGSANCFTATTSGMSWNGATLTSSSGNSLNINI